MIKDRFKNIIFVFVALLAFYSCDSHKVYEKNIDVENAVWDWHQKAQFRFDIKDTVKPNNIFINIRNTGNYKYSNIYLFITLTAPNGQSRKDTFNCTLADDKGHWYGKGSGDLWEHHILWKKGVIFPQTGQYEIDIVQAMRDKKLPNITDVGVRIEKIY